MTEVGKKTNGDRVTPVIEGARKGVRDLVTHVREHPDEAAVAAAPVVLMALATSRHKLSMVERVMVSEVSYWCGVLLLREYRAWKERPARPLPKLRKVI
jgi:hypothetical protein